MITSRERELIRFAAGITAAANHQQFDGIDLFAALGIALTTLIRSLGDEQSQHELAEQFVALLRDCFPEHGAHGRLH